MIVEIKNFGPIESFTFDLNKDLHFIIGENGVGKSYACYCLYCVLKNMWNSAQDVENIRLSVNTTLDVSDDEILLNDIIVEHLSKALSNSFIKSLKNSFSNTFTSLDKLINNYSKENYSVLIQGPEFRIMIDSDDNGVPLLSSIELRNNFTIKKENQTNISFYIGEHKWKTIPNSNFEEGFSIERFRFLDECLKIVTFQIATAFRSYQYTFLPSSRSGLYTGLNSLVPIMLQLSQNRNSLPNRTIQIPSLPDHIGDYFIDLSTLNPSNENQGLDLSIKNIEHDILKGKVRFDKDRNKIFYNAKTSEHLDLSLEESSSMVAELSSIVLFLKHVVNHKYKDVVDADWRDSIQNLMIIEEPETHLHPELQIRFIETLAALIDQNIKLILTSHSDYMFNKLNNMILDHKVDPKRIGIYHIINTPKGSIVNPEVQATEEGMIDTNFAKSAEALFEERMEILERQNSTV
ncbi:MAG: AAA family ATPase [Haliscomenobacter sp.]|uniref:AAA family ATPase n=1 Tax=Haliscomenobacter sp. TaxID=2717303 RepID=UPI0029A29DFD|nr:AAA family ATPase [Haliscomenobacter sp.]MDX2069639.1 AAA family ATPase [Haliscomenobacter sp.]